VGKIYYYIDLLSDAIKTINLRHIKWLYLQKNRKTNTALCTGKGFCMFSEHYVAHFQI